MESLDGLATPAPQPTPALPATRLVEVEVVEACDVVSHADAAVSAYVALQVGDVYYKTGPRHVTLQNPTERRVTRVQTVPL